MLRALRSMLVAWVQTVGARLRGRPRRRGWPFAFELMVRFLRNDYAELEGLAPVLVTVGEAELPRDDILALAAKLKDAGVDVALHVAEDMPHNAPVFAAYHPAAKRALDAVVSFIEAQLSRDLGSEGA